MSTGWGSIFAGEQGWLLGLFHALDHGFVLLLQALLDTANVFI
jgi:hypothetical protein